MVIFSFPLTGKCSKCYLKVDLTARSDRGTCQELYAYRNQFAKVVQHLCWSLFLIELQTLIPETLLKRDANTGFFLLFLRHFLEHIF